MSICHGEEHKAARKCLAVLMTVVKRWAGALLCFEKHKTIAFLVEWGAGGWGAGGRRRP